MGGRGEVVMDDLPKGRPLAIDITAQSASPTQPAFIARPQSAPVYHGFVVLNDVTVGGFTLGKITDFEAQLCEEGDAFVIAPDGSRAGLVWEFCDKPHFQEVMPAEASRWGVWGVGFLLPMTSRENALRNLESILPDLNCDGLNGRHNSATATENYTTEQPENAASVSIWVERHPCPPSKGILAG